MVCPKWEYAAVVWSPHKKKGIKRKERIQKSTTKIVLSLKDLPYAMETETPNLGKQKRGNLKAISKASNETEKADRDANVMPLYKGGVYSDSLNYRPISLTSVCSKSYEKIIVSQLYKYLNDNNILSSQQYGFMAGKNLLVINCYSLVPMSRSIMIEGVQ